MVEEKKGNPFIIGFKKNIGREITVVMFNPNGITELTGKCEAVDFVHKSIIIRDEDFTYTIPRYLYLKRPRKVR